jgi:ribonuclease D
LDTEFVRRKTFYAELGLIQLAFDQEIALIDPNAPLDWTGLKDAMAKPSLLKILHAVGEDLEVLHDQFKVVPSPVFDTQVAAAYCGFGQTISLVKLVETLLHETLDKSETTSDWLARPLTPAQLHYAAEDVRVLLPLHDLLRQQLQEKQRGSWVSEECARLVDKARANAVDTQPHHRHKSADRMSVAEQQRLWALLRWRDNHARQRNLPKNWVLAIADAFTLAQMDCRDFTHFEARLEKLLPTRKRSAREFFTLMTETDFSSFQRIPQLTSLQKATLQQLRARAQTASTQLELPSELIAPRRILEAYACGHIDASALSWRQDFLLQDDSRPVNQAGVPS